MNSSFVQQYLNGVDSFPKSAFFATSYGISQLEMFKISIKQIRELRLNQVMHSNFVQQYLNEADCLTKHILVRDVRDIDQTIRELQAKSNHMLGAQQMKQVLIYLLSRNHSMRTQYISKD